MTMIDVFADSDGNFMSLSEALEGVGGVELAQGGGSPDVDEIAAPRGTVKLDEFATSTSESADTIRRVLRAKQRLIKYCYEKQLKVNPRLTGRVVTTLSISAGKVTSVEIGENSTGDSELGKCIVGWIRRCRFPKETTEVVQLPWVLAPN